MFFFGTFSFCSTIMSYFASCQDRSTEAKVACWHGSEMWTGLASEGPWGAPDVNNEEEETQGGPKRSLVEPGLHWWQFQLYISRKINNREAAIFHLLLSSISLYLFMTFFPRLQPSVAQFAICSSFSCFRFAFSFSLSWNFHMQLHNFLRKEKLLFLSCRFDWQHPLHTLSAVSLCVCECVCARGACVLASTCVFQKFNCSIWSLPRMCVYLYACTFF